TVHAFVDESQRGSRYYLAAAIVEPARLGPTRRALRALLMPGQREIHFCKEKPPRQRSVSDAVARLPVKVRIYHRTCGRQNEPARQQCVSAMVRDLLDIDARRLVIDSRDERDMHDQRTLHEALVKRPQESSLVYEHGPSTGDALLWIADVAAWCYGAGGSWRTRINPIIGAVHDGDRP
ncbi:MAG TPA: hypothetical protein VG317_02750, partial [Pseudonocardiaceae bacterium]|nr:hypothetical protein [Pseudonocardiaceae bacterium]